MEKRISASMPDTFRTKGWGIPVTLAMAVMLSACGSEDDTYTSDSSSSVKQSTPAQISQTSADNYDDNVNGLITGSTLKSWIDNWSSNRPADITGKLVILQAWEGEEGYKYVESNGTDVFTYKVDTGEWTETRSNGVIQTRSMVPSGRTMDSFLAKYNIDPAKDMIVCAQGTAGGYQAMLAGRCWYMFRYWGTPKEHVAVLNGGNQWNGENTTLTFADSSNTPPMSGSASVKDLPEINFALQATLEDMMDVVPAKDGNFTGDGVFIWDARGNNLPASLPDSGSDEYSPDGDSDHRNGGATQGHPNGALLLSYANIVDSAEGYTFKSKADIASYLNGDTVDGAQFVDSTLQGIGSGKAYQEGDTIYTYCETTFRAMVTGFASGAILGKPTRFYDGAMYEWHSMSNVVASDGEYILPSGSPWRTDKSEWSMYRVASDPDNISPRSIDNAYANSANAIINEDLAYKGISVGTDSDSDSSDSDGSSGDGGSTILPDTNPCG